MFPVPLFASWRRVWDRSESVRAFGEQADQLASLRNRLVLRPADDTILREFEGPLRVFWELYQDSAPLREGRPVSLDEYARVVKTVQPVIEACRWPRWLYLERALAEASGGSDLLTAAVILRTQIDDLAIHLEIENWTHNLFHPDARRGGSEVLQLHRVRAYVELLSTRVLTRRHYPTPEEMMARFKDPKPPSHLAPYRSALLDYVHPNYGSHAATIRPEESQAGSILLEAFGRIYETFFRLRAVQALPSVSGSTGRLRIRNARREWATFIEETAPRIDARMRRRGHPPQPLSRFQDRIRRDRRNEAWFQRHIDRMQMFVRPLCEALVSSPPLALTERQLSKFPLLLHPEYGLPASAYAWMVAFPAARESGERLDHLAEDLGRIAPSDPGPLREGMWLAFVVTATEMSVLLTELKVEAMCLATVRMLNRNNPLGAALCARSLLEHYAVAKYLAEQLERCWTSIEAAPHTELSQRLDDLERSVARFLAGTTKTAELATRWRERWKQRGAAEPLGLAQVVESAFPGEKNWRNFLWNYLSRVIKGTQLTGGDLLEPGCDELVSVLSAKPLMLLADLEDLWAKLDVVAPVERVLVECRRIREVLQSDAGISLEEEVRRGALPPKLEVGHDFFGSGTEADPFRFRPPLNYHKAFDRFCREQGIDGRREMWRWQEQGLLGDRVAMPDGREIYFCKGPLAGGDQVSRE